MVYLKPKHPSQSEGRRSDTREDKLSYLKSFVHRYFGTTAMTTALADDHEVDTSNAAATAESSYTYDVDSEPAVFYFPDLLAFSMWFSIHASEEVQRVHVHEHVHGHVHMHEHVHGHVHVHVHEHVHACM